MSFIRRTYWSLCVFCHEMDHRMILFNLFLLLRDFYINGNLKNCFGPNSYRKKLCLYDLLPLKRRENKIMRFNALFLHCDILDDLEWLAYVRLTCRCCCVNFWPNQNTVCELDSLLRWTSRWRTNYKVQNQSVIPKIWKPVHWKNKFSQIILTVQANNRTSYVSAHHPALDRNLGLTR